MCLVDLADYIDAHNKMDKLYRDRMKWAKASLKNVAGTGYFSSDRSIEEYVSNIWGLTKLS